MILLFALIIVGGALIAALAIAAVAELVARDAPPVVAVGVPFLLAELLALGFAVLLSGLGLA